MLNPRDRQALKKIIQYCDQIQQTVRRFGGQFETYQADFVFQNACSMCLLQIGELVPKLTDELIQSHTYIPWRGIKATRNLLAHAYSSVELSIIWATIEKDIPQLKENCQSILDEA